MIMQEWIAQALSLNVLISDHGTAMYWAAVDFIIYNVGWLIA